MNKAPDYLLQNAARMGRNFDIFREKDCHYDCLYEDRSRDDLAAVAPYLVTVADGKDLWSWVTESGFGNSWGIFMNAAAGFEDILNHFRKFVVVKTANGGEQYFRFYDPRVLKVFLPACNESQVIDFFGPVESFIAEGSIKEEAIEYRHQNGVLQQKKVENARAFSI